MSSASTSADGAQPTEPKHVIPQENKEPVAQEKAEEKPVVNAEVTDLPKPAVIQPVEGRIVRQEEHIEYRDQNGNLLNKEQVEALKGQVEFKTRYETKTRLLDQHGNELPPNYVIKPGDVLQGEAEEEKKSAQPKEEPKVIVQEAQEPVKAGGAIVEEVV